MRSRGWPMFWASFDGPRTVEGGIAATKLGTSWWAKRWLTSLERFSDRARLSRGRNGTLPFWRASMPLDVFVIDTQRRAAARALALLGGDATTTSEAKPSGKPRRRPRGPASNKRRSV